jgi:hypothetical protein
MSFPSFSAGEVLTAADMNAVGLWLVKTQTVGTAVTSVQVTGAFSANYDNYLVTYNGGLGSIAVESLNIILGAATTGYYGNLIYGIPSSATVFSGPDNNSARWTYAGSTTTTTADVFAEIRNPFLSKPSQISGRYNANTTNGAYGTYNGFLNNSTSYTAFTLSPNAGTITGGTIRVYGYRN